MRKILYLIIFLMLTGCSSPENQTKKVTVEFRLAEMEPALGFSKEAVISSTGEKFYLFDKVEMTNDDIASASVILWQNRPAVEIMFTEAGANKFAQLTENNVTRRLGILVDGELVSAPIINAPITMGKAIINGIFTQKEAHRIADGIAAK